MTIWAKFNHFWQHLRLLVILGVGYGAYLFWTSSSKQYPVWQVAILAAISLMWGVLTRSLAWSWTMVRLRDEAKVSTFVASIILLSTVLLTIVLYASLSVKASVGILIFAASLGFIIQDYRVRNSIRQSPAFGYRGSSLSELWANVQPLSAKKTSDLMDSVNLMLRKGKVALPLCILIATTYLVPGWRESKAYKKALVRLFLRLRLYERAATTAERFLSQGCSSDTLISLKCLAQAKEGKLEDAALLLYRSIELAAVKGLEWRNPYHMLNLGYISALSRKYDNALYWTDQVLKSGNQSLSALALNNMAYFMVERELSNPSVSLETIKSTCREALLQVKQGLRANTSLAVIANLLDTIGLCYFLTGEYQRATVCFGKNAAVNPYASLHLGIVFMAESKEFLRAEYFLECAFILARREHNYQLQAESIYFKKLCREFRKERKRLNSAQVVDCLIERYHSLAPPSLTNYEFIAELARSASKRTITLVRDREESVEENIRKAKKAIEIDDLRSFSREFLRSLASPATLGAPSKHLSQEWNALVGECADTDELLIDSIASGSSSDDQE